MIVKHLSSPVSGPQSCLCSFHPQGYFVLQNSYHNCSRHIHSPGIKKRNYGKAKGYMPQLFQGSLPVPPNNFHIDAFGHSNMVKWLHVVAREKRICDLLSRNIAILSKVGVLLLRKRGTIEIGRGLAVFATQMYLCK